MNRMMCSRCGFVVDDPCGKGPEGQTCYLARNPRALPPHIYPDAARPPAAAPDSKATVGLPDLPKMANPELEHIASRLFQYGTQENLFPITLKLTIGEALDAAYRVGRSSALREAADLLENEGVKFARGEGDRRSRAVILGDCALLVRGLCPKHHIPDAGEMVSDHIGDANEKVSPRDPPLSAQGGEAEGGDAEGGSVGRRAPGPRSGCALND